MSKVQNKRGKFSHSSRPKSGSEPLQGKKRLKKIKLAEKAKQEA